jgi:hypothetical protein
MNERPEAEHEDEEVEPANEGSRVARERAQETNRLARELQPPHDPEQGRGDPSPNT